MLPKLFVAGTVLALMANPALAHERLAPVKPLTLQFALPPVVVVKQVPKTPRRDTHRVTHKRDNARPAQTCSPRQPCAAHR